MGRKRTGSGKYIYICIAFVTCCLIANCALVDRVQEMRTDRLRPPERSRVSPEKVAGPQDQARPHLVRGRRLFAQGDYDGSLHEMQKALLLSTGKPPADEALFTISLIYAHPDNPKRDSGKSIASFRRVIREYPQSLWADQAKMWVDVIQENEKAKRACAEVVQENARLRQMIEQSKKVDIEIEEKKREKAR
ncbi:MAG: hypothetical protein A4E62_02033 [Syntrophorhabdus sp. PtaU1.Bin002]|nr:MAG: hypothetical protein A4E62_02033 [Syntrophorhabdus sp. PtaU1.Bin002]